MNGLTILLPTYNESQNIEAITQRIFQFVPDARILVIDDNSPDGTALIVQKMMGEDARIHLLERPRKEGLGKAYQHAFIEALKDESNDFLLTMDADFSHDPSYIPEMIRAADSADVVVGSRYCKGGGTQGWSRRRKYLSAFANRYCALITGMPLKDATAGFNLIRAEELRSMDLSKLGSSGYAFQMELKYLLWRRGARFVEVPITFKERRAGTSKISGNIILEGVIAPWKMRFQRKKV